jgi:hypothetical protein
MAIFDFLKKKEDQADENVSLEEALKRAAGEPAYRKVFYEKLLTEKLVVITDGPSQGAEEGMLEAGSSVNIVSFPDGKVPVFTSTDRIFDKGIIKEHVPYMEMIGADLFTLAVNTTFILNPYSDYGKELLEHEIKSLLDGSIFGPTKKIVIEKDTQVRIGQPAVYPAEIVASLKLLFIKHEQVTAAYLGWIHNPETEDPPHYIFAIEGSGDLQPIMHEAGFIAEGHLGKEQIVDFIRLDGSTGIEGYFKEHTQPFYQK